MLKTGIFILFIFYSVLCNGQIDSVNRAPDRHYNLKLTYISSVIYPGISTGMEIPVLPVKLKEVKRLHNQYIIKAKFISGNLNWYHHPEFHDNLYLTAEWVMRRTRSEGFISEFSAGPGYSKTFLAGTTYRVSDNGNISVIKNAGYNYAVITIGGGLGYDFSLKKHLPFSTFAKMNLLSMFPYNSTIYVRPVLEFGIRFEPVNLWNKIIKKESIKIPK
jgi:hypothetical protein